MTQRLNFIWLGLLVATALTTWLGESGQRGAWTVVLMFGLALAKGLFVALDFMELRHAPALWRRLVIGWLLVVLALVLLAYRLGGPA